MRNSIRILIAFALPILVTSCVLPTNPSDPKETVLDSAQFDALLAKQLGADDYGMRPYVLVVLMTGPNDSIIKDEQQRGDLFKGHFANMTKLAEEKKLAVAGPFSKSKTHRGLLIFSVESLEEAKQLVETDPTVQAGIFTYEMTRLYASAALMKVGDIHQKIQKTKIN